MTHMTRFFAVSAGLVLALLGLSGCLERKEKIKVQRDGGVEFQLQLEGDPGDFAAGDALPENHGGWQTHDETVKDDDGKEKQRREAKLRVPAGGELPDSFAAKDEPLYAAALKFPTTLRVERRADGTYYHFKRVYRGREQARYEYYRKALEKIDSPVKRVQELAGKDPSELSDAERATLVNALRMLESLKMVEYVRGGTEALGDQWPQHYGLKLRQAALDTFERADVGPVLARLQEPPGPERDAAIDEFGKHLIETARKRLRETLRKLDVPAAQIEAFDAGYEREEQRRAVTEDLGDERWEVRLELPGELVAHNGDAIEDGNVVWIFDGEALMDRDVVLMATSRVAGNGK